MADAQHLDLETIAIDLDGTLVDSLPDLARAANHTLTQCGLAPLAEEVVRGMIGDGIDTLLLRCLVQALGRDPQNSELEAGIPVMRAYYASHVFDHSCLFPGAAEALAHWRDRGIRLACVTNKASTLTLPLLQRAELTRYFDAVYCADTPADRKPSPAMLLRLLAERGTTATRCAMIGDSTHDMGAAHAAGMVAIGVDYGYGDPCGDPETPPDLMLSRLDELRL